MAKNEQVIDENAILLINFMYIMYTDLINVNITLIINKTLNHQIVSRKCQCFKHVCAFIHKFIIKYCKKTEVSVFPRNHNQLSCNGTQKFHARDYWTLSELVQSCRIWVSHGSEYEMEAARTSETLVNFYQTTQRYNPEDSHLLVQSYSQALQ
jgi:hypothetical protein